MLSNNDVLNLRYDRLLTTFGYNLLTIYGGSTQGRQMGRVLALALGAPVELVAVADRVNQMTMAVMLHMFEKDYISATSVWGEEYSRVYNREGQPAIYRTQVNSTDLARIALIGILNGDVYTILNKLLDRSDDVDGSVFGDFVVQLINNRSMGSDQVAELLIQCSSGPVIRGVMDKMEEHKLDTRVRSMLVAIRGRRDFQEIARNVTNKIAATIQIAP